jgi:hypothetical protein
MPSRKRRSVDLNHRKDDDDENTGTVKRLRLKPVVFSLAM